MGLQAEFRSGLLFFPIAWRSWRLGGWFLVIEPPRRQERQGRLYGVESSLWLQSVKLRVLGCRGRLLSDLSDGCSARAVRVVCPLVGWGLADFKTPLENLAFSEAFFKLSAALS